MRAKKPITAELSAANSLTDDAKNITSVFSIVGIGASAGGLEAFEEFLRHFSPKSGMAFVLVPHLAPNHDSLLTEILQRTTTMPILEAQDQLIVEPNKVYIIPPNRDMTIFNGKLLLNLPHEPRGQRMPIDIFFRSLAEDQKENAIGIILSGTGSDGTLGLGEVYRNGGITLVQDPLTAKYDGMPTSAIDAGYACQVLPVGQMPALLLSDGRALCTQPEYASNPKTISGMSRILMLLRSFTGHDFSHYKKSTIGRRVDRRMLQHNMTDLEIYARYLKEYPAEAHILFKELLINVTSFFRDAEAFAMLQKDILPQLCSNKPDDYVFRVWVAGCASGEEAYSIAILLYEIMEKMQYVFKVQIYATDLDDDAIATARLGIYPVSITQDVTSERLRRFFTKEDAGYKIKLEIREMIVFAVQNVIKDPPFTKLDLLSCRNLMIYLEAELQNKLMPTFHYALKSGGVLFLSPSEGIGNFTQLFLPIDRKWKLYRAIHPATTVKTIISSATSLPVASSNEIKEKIMKQTKEINLAELSRRLLLQYFAPASVITDFKGNILYVHGETGKYLRPAPGQASLNVIEMAHEGLETGLRAAILAASNESKSTISRELQVKTNGGFTTVGLSVRPLPTSLSDDRNMLLLSFQDIAKPTAKSSRTRVAKSTELMRIAELEQELLQLKESYQTIIEEQQASNEELKSTNEEMQSTNEEMQSSNEELETSKEELQSVNEELITVNSELQTKIDQLSVSQNDMKNLLENMNVGIIFLDKHLVIRNFTREAVRVYRLAPSDIGRPLVDIRSIADQADDLMIAAQRVLDSLIPYEAELHILNSWILVRIQPYRTLDNFIDGVVLTFTDITARIKDVTTNEALRLANSIVNTLHEPLIVLDNMLTVVTSNNAFYQQFQVNQKDTLNHKFYELGNGQWNISVLRQRLADLLQNKVDFENFEVEHDFPTIGWHKVLLSARYMLSSVGEPQFILLSIEIKT